jgi:hypothetical protein
VHLGIFASGALKMYQMLLAMVGAPESFSRVSCSKSTDAAGAPMIAGISSQAKSTTAKLENERKRIFLKE